MSKRRKPPELYSDILARYWRALRTPDMTEGATGGEHQTTSVRFPTANRSVARIKQGLTAPDWVEAFRTGSTGREDRVWIVQAKRARVSDWSDSSLLSQSPRSASLPDLQAWQAFGRRDILYEQVLRGTVVRDYGATVTIEFYLAGDRRIRRDFERTTLSEVGTIYEGAPVRLRTRLEYAADAYDLADDEAEQGPGERIALTAKLVRGSTGSPSRL